MTYPSNETILAVGGHRTTPTVGEFFNSIPQISGGICSDIDNPDIFFEENPKNQGPAKTMCGNCPRLEACREWGIDHTDEQGIWGGLNQDERKAEAERTKGLKDAGLDMARRYIA